MDHDTVPSPAKSMQGERPSEMHAQSPRPWHTWPAEDVIVALHTSAAGLSSEDARARLDEVGANEIRAAPPKSLTAMVREQVTDPLVLILLVAAILSALLGEWAEAGIIFAIVVVNATIGIVQERKAQSSLEALRTMSAPSAQVIRGGIEEILPAHELVPGDLVMLHDGSMVPADLRLLHTWSLRVQEAALTGESVPVEKDAHATVALGAPLGDRLPMAYATSIVSGGRGVGVVVATGMNTEVGHIAGMLEGGADTDTPLKRKLASFGKLLTVVGIAAALAVIAIGLAYGRPFAPLLLLAISLAISVIPESLPATATITMALGVQRMAGHHALVRKLPAIEALGNSTVVCTDKTGTLTENRMRVVKVALIPDIDRSSFTDPPEARARHDELFEELAFVAALCNDASLADVPAGEGADEVIGDPTEGALLILARDNGIDSTRLRTNHPRLMEQPFDSDRKRMSTVHERDGQLVAAVKGAIDQLLPHCTHVMDEQGLRRPLTDGDRARALSVAAEMADEALRVLAFAVRILPSLPDDGEDIERELTFVGLTGMMDPPRPEVREAVETCRTAGIRTIMITGDHAATATAIGRDLDIYRQGNLVVTGQEMDEMDDAGLAEAAAQATVFARVSPCHKLRIVRALKSDGEMVAMTGDGVNDAPALKSADIGVAMGITGTDVAKDASDMILLDDRFATIVYAIREGRRVFRNIQKVVQFLLVDNIAEILVLLIAVLLNWDPPLTAVMILWINLATATLPALALGVEPASRHVMEHPPVKAGTLLEPQTARRVIVQGAFVALLALCAFALGRDAGGEAVGRTMAFGVLAFSQVLRALNQRSSTDPIWNREGGRNPWLVGAVAASAALMVVALSVPALHDAFGTAPMGAAQWAAVGGLALLSLVQAEAAKALGRLRANRP